MNIFIAIGLALALGGLPQDQEAASPPTGAAAGASLDGMPLGLKPTGEAAVVATGEVAKGKPVVSLPVRHAITGRVAKEIPRVLFSKTVVVGAPAFGVPMTSSKGETQIVWCAPVSTDSRPGKEAWSTNCFVQIPGGATQMVMTGGLYPTMLSTGQALFAEPPQITPGPADFGVPLSLNYVFRKWTAAGDAELMIEVRWPRRADYPGLAHAKREGDHATLRLAGGEIRLTPTPDGRSAKVELVRPLTTGPAAAP